MTDHAASSAVHAAPSERTIGYLEKVLALNGVPSHWRLCVQGVIILAAVLLQERRP